MKIKCTGIDTVLADPMSNAKLIKEEIKKAVDEKVDILVFPDEALTGVNLGNITTNDTLIREIEKAIKEIENFREDLSTSMVVYIPQKYGSKNKLGVRMEPFPIIVESYSAIETLDSEYQIILDKEMDVIGSKGYHIYCADGSGQSTTDNVYTSLKMIFFDGTLVAKSNEKTMVYDSSIDTPIWNTKKDKNINCDYFDGNKMPYVPDYLTKNEICNKIVEIQGKGLIQRMKSMGRNKIIMGISGGLDSTVALLSCVNIFKKYGLDPKNIIGITMPGLGTTDRTYRNALALMKATGITIKDIDLKTVLNLTIKNLELAADDFGLTYQQTQSRERTQVLLDYANKENGIVIGTGCMSEFALGWMTYGGDHLSMYAIAVGLPKTLVKELSQYFLRNTKDKKLHAVLNDIIDTPVSPELAPVTKSGEQNQKTEKIIGDYIIHDFFLFHLMVNEYSIRHIFNLACKTFTEFTPKQIFECLKVFVTRFFTRQYKKNCFAEGVQILNYSLSPRTGWKMPGDISNNIWARELKEIEATL